MVTAPDDMLNGRHQRLSVTNVSKSFEEALVDPTGPFSIQLGSGPPRNILPYPSDATEGSNNMGGAITF